MLSFFLFLPISLEGRGILLSVSQMGKWRNGGEESMLTMVKVGAKSGCKSVTKSAGGCRHLSSEGSALAITSPSQLPLREGVGQTCLSRLLQGFREKMHLKALLTGTVLFIHLTCDYMYKAMLALLI